MGILPENKSRLTFSLITFILLTTAVGKDIENYDELCRECQKYKDSYRIRGWVCWSACGSQQEPVNNFKEHEKQNDRKPETRTNNSTTPKTKVNRGKPRNKERNKLTNVSQENGKDIKQSNLSHATEKIIKQTNFSQEKSTNKTNISKEIKKRIKVTNTSQNNEKLNMETNFTVDMNDRNWTLKQFLSDTYRQLLHEPSKLFEVFKKARCIFPRDIDSITRALLLQQCFSRNQAQGNETVCYEELGCFPMESPWVSLLRPFPTPHTPDEIDVKLYLYTRKENERFVVPLWPNIDLNMSDFDPKRERTVFIVHGFANNGNVSWMSEMKDAYLKNVDANIFLVDWGNGASLFNYLQVASNTRIVGAEVARFVRYLLNVGVSSNSLHMIGHSLGSHICSYTGKNVADIAKLGRITALDPAQPGFEIESTEVRLVKDDAEFVDVIHTDAKPFIPFVGFGLLLPAGHVDFYLNGGTNQPGCLTNINVGKLKSIYDLADIPVEVISQWVSCSHGRAYHVFIAALHHKKDCLWARKIPVITNIIKVTAMGALNLLDPFLESWDSCTMDSCTTVGLLTPNLRGRGIFALSTTSASPFCVTDDERDKKIKNILSLGLISVGNKIKDSLTSLFTSVT